MADNIDKALNELDLKTDSLPNDWLITLINPKTGEPAQNMTIARFIELLTNTMSSLMGIHNLAKGMNFVSKDIGYGDSYTIGVVWGLFVIRHGWSNSEAAILFVDPYQKKIGQIAGRSYDSVPVKFEFAGNYLKITSTYGGNSGNNTTFNIAYQSLV